MRKDESGKTIFDNIINGVKKRYDNGELVTKERIQDEDWYGSLYQPFLESVFASECLLDVDSTYEYALQCFRDFFSEELSETDKDRILRWSVLHVERRHYQPDFNELIENITK